MTFELRIPRDTTLNALIREARLDDCHQSINPVNFRIETRRQRAFDIINVELLDLGREVSMNEVITEARSRNLRVSTLKEILVLSRKFSTAPLKRPIAALGSVWQEGGSYLGGPVMRYFPYLYAFDRYSKRGLDLFWLEVYLDENWLFACTRI